MNYTYFLMLHALPAWLRLPRERRRELVAGHLQPLIASTEGLTVRHFDSEAFTAVCSDLMMIETGDPRQHYFFMERLRDSPLVCEPYFDIVQIVPALEDGYLEFEREG